MKNITLITIACAAALLGACTTPPPKATAAQSEGTSPARSWNGGIWNSVLGYHGPSNTMDPSTTGN